MYQCEEYAHLAYQTKCDTTFYETQNKINNLLWDNVHLHPEIKRSLSFPMLETINTFKVDENFNRFHHEFIKHLNDENYHLDKIGDRFFFYHPIMEAYQKIDPQAAAKLLYLHHKAKINLDPYFLQELAIHIKVIITT